MLISPNRRTLLAAAAALALLPAAARAGAPGSAEDYIRDMAGRALGIMQSKATEAAKVEQLTEIFRLGLDLETIGRFALGSHWSKANEAQRAEYQRTFASVIVKNYARLWSTETPLSYQITGQQQVSDRDTLVNTEVRREGNRPPLRLGWRVRSVEGGYKIIDVMVDGISMLITQRDDFNSAVQRNGVDGLIAMLKERDRQL